MRSIMPLLSIVACYLAACGSPDRNIDLLPTDQSGTTSATETSLPEDISDSATQSEYSYTAPGDPRARYALLSVEQQPSGMLIAMTRRDGPSGTSYSRREIDCEAQLFRYIGEGDTIEEAMIPATSLAEMAPLVEGSSSHSAVQAACSNRP